MALILVQCHGQMTLHERVSALPEQQYWAADVVDRPYAMRDAGSMVLACYR